MQGPASSEATGAGRRDRSRVNAIITTASARLGPDAAAGQPDYEARGDRFSPPTPGAADESFGDVGGVRIRLHDAGAGRVQSPRSMRRGWR
jgi:hypothetical protein